MKKKLFLNRINHFPENMENDRLVEKLLREELKMTLRGDFADRIADRALQRFEWKQRIQQFAIYLAIVIFGLLTAGATLYLITEDKGQSWLHFLSENLVYLILILVISIFILFVDKVILPVLMLRTR